MRYLYLNVRPECCKYGNIKERGVGLRSGYFGAEAAYKVISQGFSLPNRVGIKFIDEYIKSESYVFPYLLGYLNSHLPVLTPYTNL